MSGIGVRRRAVLLGAAAAAVAPGAGWLDALAARARSGLLLSYEGLLDTAFDRAHANCAYVYDNAAVGVALLAGGRIAAARVVGDALVAAQTRDRFWHDGRFRNAYAAGKVPPTGTYPLPGWWDKTAGHWVEDSYQVGTATGVVAWAMIFLARLGAATGDPRYHDAAGRAGDWVEHNVRAARGYAGGFTGWEPTPARLAWVSTEQNLDLAAAFTALGRADAARHARDFVAAMWNAQEGRFFLGLAPDGGLNRGGAADANLWPPLLAGAPADWGRALDWVLARQGVPTANPAGIDFNDDRDGIWLEGTAYVALLARLRGRPALAARMIDTLRQQTAPCGLPWAASVPRLTTGLAIVAGPVADFYYYRRPAIAPAAWAALAEAGANPFVA